MFELIRADLVAPSRTAELPCGCVGVALSHDDEFVQFGVTQAACEEHQTDDIALVENELGNWVVG
jgi:hypothetical protein